MKACQQQGCPRRYVQRKSRARGERSQKVWWSQLRASSEYAHRHFWSLYQSWMKQHVKWLSCQGWWLPITKRTLTVYDLNKGSLGRASQVQAGLDPFGQTKGNELGLHSVKEVGLGIHARAREMSHQCQRRRCTHARTFFFFFLSASLHVVPKGKERRDLKESAVKQKKGVRLL